jgi:hypothetical protein
MKKLELAKCCCSIFGGIPLGIYMLNGLINWKIEKTKETCPDGYSFKTTTTMFAKAQGHTDVAKLTVITKPSAFFCEEKLDKNMKFIIQHPFVGKLWWKLVYMNKYEYFLEK